MFPHRTGIYQDNACLFDVVGYQKVSLLQRRTNQGGVKLVHLTSEALYVYSFAVHPQRVYQFEGAKSICLQSKPINGW